MQDLMSASADYAELDSYFEKTGAKSILLVCGSSFEKLRLHAYFETLEQRCGIRTVSFSDFQPNPDYSSAVKGTAVFRENHCDLIAAVGGGSAMDVAKCIKRCALVADPNAALHQAVAPNTVPLLAIPTTAGSGSEATRFAVIYENGVKQSVTDDSILPSAVLFDPDVLKTLPDYQKKSTMLDAVCHAVESFWSVHSSEESMGYAKTSLRMIAANMGGYLANTESGNRNMLKAAHFAGKAINLTKTTAGHAMCYKLTTTYGIAHGHAAALCVKVLLPYMQAHPELCIDSRGAAHLEYVYSEIADAFGCSSGAALPLYFEEFVNALVSGIPEKCSEDTLKMLTNSVNTERLQNHPIRLTPDVIGQLYRQLMKQG